MCRIAASISCRNPRLEGWPCYYQSEEACAFERYFIHEFERTSLHEWQKNLGILIPFAEVFDQVTKNFAYDQNVTENEKEAKEKDPITNAETTREKQQRITHQETILQNKQTNN